MNTENIKKSKLKKQIITTLILFAIILILPTFISSLATKVNASYSYKTYGDSTKSSDYTYAKLLNALDQLTYSNFASINKNSKKITGLGGLMLGSDITTADDSSVNCHVYRRYASYEEQNFSYLTTAFCYHATVSSDTSAQQNSSTKGTDRYIRAIIIIEDRKSFHTL